MSFKFNFLKWRYLIWLGIQWDCSSCNHYGLVNKKSSPKVSGMNVKLYTFWFHLLLLYAATLNLKPKNSYCKNRPELIKSANNMHTIYCRGPFIIWLNMLTSPFCEKNRFWQIVNWMVCGRNCTHTSSSYI